MDKDKIEKLCKNSKNKELERLFPSLTREKRPGFIIHPNTMEWVVSEELIIKHCVDKRRILDFIAKELKYIKKNSSKCIAKKVEEKLKVMIKELEIDKGSFFCK